MENWMNDEQLIIELMTQWINKLQDKWMDD